MPINGGGEKGGREEGSKGGRSVHDDEFSSEHVEFEMIIVVQKVLEM